MELVRNEKQLAKGPGSNPVPEMSRQTDLLDHDIKIDCVYKEFTYLKSHPFGNGFPSKAKPQCRDLQGGCFTLFNLPCIPGYKLGSRHGPSTDSHPEAAQSESRGLLESLFMAGPFKWYIRIVPQVVVKGPKIEFHWFPSTICDSRINTLLWLEVWRGPDSEDLIYVRPGATGKNKGKDW